MFLVTCFMICVHMIVTQCHGSSEKVLFPNLKQGYTTSIAVYSLSIIGHTISSSFTLATTSLTSSSSGYVFCHSNVLTHGSSYLKDAIVGALKQKCKIFAHMSEK